MKDVTGLYNQVNFNVVLVEPQIPNNTGNIGRLCVASSSRLHIVKPIGFEISDKRLKRAGLDYWQHLEVCYHESFNDFINQLDKDANLYFLSSRAEKSLYNVELKQNDWLIFGQESDGLSDDIKSKFSDQLIKIPFPGKVRSFNLSNAVSMVLGEGLRQIGKFDM